MLKHYFDKYINIYYLISSSSDKSIKLCNINNIYKNILIIVNASNPYNYFPLFMIFKNNHTLIGSGNRTGKLNIYDFSGNEKETIKFKNHHSEVYDIEDKIYILISRWPRIILYDYTHKITKYQLISKNDTNEHNYSTIKNMNKKYIIFDSDDNGFIILWIFRYGNIIKIIEPESFDGMNIFSLCL